MEDQKTLVFVEVRYRKSARFGGALESVTESKQEKIIMASRHFLTHKKINNNTPMRFDVVGITANDLQWIKNAFQ